MSKVFVYENSNSGISLGNPTEEALKNQTIEQIAEQAIPTGTVFYVVDDSTLPSVLNLFNAWVFSTPPEIVVDLDRAKVQYKQIADSTAASLSTPLTQEYMRLTAIGGDTTAVQAQLVAINAAAEETAYLNATSVPQLVACWPSELGPNPFLP
jgi:hypothetical protein